MINLIALSCSNIGPFKDQILTVFFDQGKFLIKAPVGSGKSFLFFDAPIYGLYKYSGRNILNIKSKQGYIKLLFESEGQHYLIIRSLTKGKSKESCATTLYKVEGLDRSSGGKFIRHDSSDEVVINADIQDELKKNPHIQLEEITFKNESDLQQTLQNILPPKEVFLNTVFLVQDSANIFELAPADRLMVLKNVFGLIGIDEAKEKIAEKKKEIWYKLKATTDSSKFDDKIKFLLSEYIKNYKELSEYDLLENILTPQGSFFDEMENIKDKVNINEFGVADFPVQINAEIDQIVEKNKSEYQKILHQIQTLEESHKVESQKLESLEQEKKQLTKTSEQLTVKINEIDPNKVTKLKEEKRSLQEHQIKLEKQIKNDEIEKFVKANKDLLEDFKSSKEPVQNGYILVQYLKNKGKFLQEEIKNIQLQSKHNEDLIKDYQGQLKDLENKISMFDKDIDQQATFDCSKVGTNCPFIKVINKKTFEQLDKQKALLNKEKIALEEKINITKKFAIESSADKEKFMEGIKKILQEIDRKNIEAMYETAQELTDQEKKIDQQIAALEVGTQKLEEYKLQIEKNKVQIENTEKLLNEAEKKILETRNLKLDLDGQIKKINYNEILEIEKMNVKMKEIYRDIGSLVNEFKNLQIQVKQLQEEEIIMGNLYTIFSKELLLLVLQDHLPVLSDIINSYLAQVVEYQISFALNKTGTDKLELLAQIFDDKGERDVKSLSGGQRVILKIVWMLAISSYIHSPILFLDETINNLDADTVGKVSDMLENFVKQRAMKLYTVTHNAQIQDLRIWDKIINLEDWAKGSLMNGNS